MKVLHFATYNSWPIGINYNHFNNMLGSGWFISVCYPFFGRKFIVQLRKDN